MNMEDPNCPRQATKATKADSGSVATGRLSGERAGT